jgi:hypothetical protein
MAGGAVAASGCSAECWILSRVCRRTGVEVGGASGAQILTAPEALPSVGRRGFDRMRKHYTVAAMTDAYVDAINAVLSAESRAG